MPEITIEIASKNSNRVVFKPLLSKPLRGRWTIASTGGESTAEVLRQLMAVAPEIPGIRIAIDPQKRQARVYDPLGLPENKTLQEEIARVLNNHQQWGWGAAPWPTATRDEMSANDIKTWLYEMRRLVDSGLAVIVSGSATLPSLAEIRSKAPGRRTRMFFDTSQQLAETSVYADNVEATRA